ncbi:MAG: sugar ABC transporter substrate-binding protein [Lachnospiraceae bacterium]|jgi:inositol transport system substrate-binding protein|nr:sugar ABC transporter substrate-binding protein [Lachnospiraceae bacterium]
MKRKVIQKVLVGLLCVSMLGIIITGCNKETPAEETNTTDEGTTEAVADEGAEAGEGGIIALSLSQTDTFLATLRDATQAAVEAAGYEFQVQDAQKDQQMQITNIQKYAADPNVKAIIICPKEATAAAQMVEAAGGKPVVFVNRQPDEADLVEGKVVFAGSDEVVAGETQGAWLAKHFADKADKTIKVGLLLGELGHPGTIGRTAGFQQVLKEAGFTVEIVNGGGEGQTGNWDRKEGQNLTDQILLNYPDVDVIVANNDDMALGAVEAIQNAGKTTEEIPVVGVDATDPGIESLKAGGLSMTVFQDAVGQGNEAVKCAIAMINGENVPKLNYVPFIEVSADSDEAGLLK